MARRWDCRAGSVGCVGIVTAPLLGGGRDKGGTMLAINRPMRPATMLSQTFKIVRPSRKESQARDPLPRRRFRGCAEQSYLHLHLPSPLSALRSPLSALRSPLPSSTHPRTLHTPPLYFRPPHGLAITARTSCSRLADSAVTVPSAGARVLAAAVRRVREGPGGRQPDQRRRQDQGTATSTLF